MKVIQWISMTSIICGCFGGDIQDWTDYLPNDTYSMNYLPNDTYFDSFSSGEVYDWDTIELPVLPSVDMKCYEETIVGNEHDSNNEPVLPFSATNGMQNIEPIRDSEPMPHQVNPISPKKYIINVPEIIGHIKYSTQAAATMFSHVHHLILDHFGYREDHSMVIKSGDLSQVFLQKVVAALKRLCLLPSVCRQSSHPTAIPINDTFMNLLKGRLARTSETVDEVLNRYTVFLYPLMTGMESLRAEQMNSVELSIFLSKLYLSIARSLSETFPDYLFEVGKGYKVTTKAERFLAGLTETNPESWRPDSGGVNSSTVTTSKRKRSLADDEFESSRKRQRKPEPLTIQRQSKKDNSFVFSVRLTADMKSQAKISAAKRLFFSVFQACRLCIVRKPLDCFANSDTKARDGILIITKLFVRICEKAEGLEDLLTDGAMHRLFPIDQQFVKLFKTRLQTFIKECTESKLVRRRNMWQEYFLPLVAPNQSATPKTITAHQTLIFSSKIILAVAQAVFKSLSSYTIMSFEDDVYDISKTEERAMAGITNT